MSERKAWVFRAVLFLVLVACWYQQRMIQDLEARLRMANIYKVTCYSVPAPRATPLTSPDEWQVRMVP